MRPLFTAIGSWLPYLGIVAPRSTRCSRQAKPEPKSCSRIAISDNRRQWNRFIGSPGSLAVVALCVPILLHAQLHTQRLKPDGHRDNGFVFCRLQYTKVRSEPDGSGWTTDFPFADRNFMTRFSELTTAPVDFDEDGDPRHWVANVSNPVSDALSTCPFVIASDVGTLEFSDGDIDRIRAYLLKGGFLWVDDFWGPAAWSFWAIEIGRVLPPREYPIRDVPPDHALRRGMYLVDVPQIAHIGFWSSTGGSTSERGDDSAEVHFRMITDRDDRIMVLMTHNTDIQDAWEREGNNQFFAAFAADGYSVGLNVMLYAMTH